MPGRSTLGIVAARPQDGRVLLAVALLMAPAHHPLDAARALATKGPRAEERLVAAALAAPSEERARWLLELAPSPRVARALIEVGAMADAERMVAKLGDERRLGADLVTGWLMVKDEARALEALLQLPRETLARARALSAVGLSRIRLGRDREALAILTGEDFPATRNTVLSALVAAARKIPSPRRRQRLLAALEAMPGSQAVRVELFEAWRADGRFERARAVAQRTGELRLLARLPGAPPPPPIDPASRWGHPALAELNEEAQDLLRTERLAELPALAKRVAAVPRGPEETEAECEGPDPEGERADLIRDVADALVKRGQIPLAALVLAATPGDEARAEGWAALVPPLATSGAPRVALLTARHLPTPRPDNRCHEASPRPVRQEALSLLARRFGSSGQLDLALAAARSLQTPPARAPEALGLAPPGREGRFELAHDWDHPAVVVAALLPAFVQARRERALVELAGSYPPEESDEVLLAAVDALGRAGRLDDAGALLSRLQDRDVQVRALIALGRALGAAEPSPTLQAAVAGLLQ